MAILSDGGLLRAETLRFAEELRSADDVGLPAPPKGAAKRARHFQKLIDDLSREALDLQEMADWYAEEIQALVQRKLAKGQDVFETEAAADEDEEQVGGEVVDLMKMLRQRLSQNATVKQALQSERPVRQPLDELSKEELYERAKVLDIAGRSHMSKKNFVQALRKAA